MRGDRDALKALGGRIRSLRQSRGLSLAGLSARCGLTAVAIGTYERAEREPGVGALLRLADGLGVTASRLLGETASARNGEAEDTLRQVRELLGRGDRGELLTGAGGKRGGVDD